MPKKRTYRRRSTSDTWHWREDCRNYPKNVKSTQRHHVVTYTGAKEKPEGGELCNQCQHRQEVENLANMRANVLVATD